MAALRGRARQQVAQDLATRFWCSPGPIAVLAHLVGRPPRQVRRLLTEAGLHTTDTTCLGLPDADLAAVLATRYQRGVSIARLRRDTGLTRRELTHHLHTHGAALRTPRPLPAEQVVWLARHYRNGATLRGLVALSGASYGAVRTALLHHGVVLRAPTARPTTPTPQPDPTSTTPAPGWCPDTERTRP